MQYKEAKDQFIQAWGILGSSWGVSRTMAQVHALLLISPKTLSAEEIMKELNISRGNVNLNVRALIDWGLVYKDLVPGERKEFFGSEKSVIELAKKVAEERRKRELQPMLRALKKVKNVKGSTEEIKEFKSVVNDIDSFAKQTDKLLNRFSRSESNWFFKSMLKIMR